MVELIFHDIDIDKTTNSPVLVLEELVSNPTRNLQIWIGETEASAIRNVLSGQETPRPMTHDLIKNIMDALSATVSAMYINKFEELTFYATLKLKSNGEEIDIDSRPSDAIAIALRYDVPIYVENSVIDENGYILEENSDKA